MSAPPNPFGHNPFDQDPIPVHPAGPPATVGEVNTLATLSVIFAFVFAPAGAILGHLGLSQIARTHQRGRDRALVGLTLSYVVITAAVVALVVWAALGHNDTGSQTPMPLSSSASTATTVSTTTTTIAPPPPIAAPADIDALMPSLEEIRGMAGDQNLTIHQDKRRVVNDPGIATLDRPECMAAVSSGSPAAYNVAAVTGYLLREARDTTNPARPVQVAAGIAAFADTAAARAQHDSLLAAWRLCGNSTVRATYPGGTVVSNPIEAPVDSGNGITRLAFTIGPWNIRLVHVLAVKANIVLDCFVGADTTSPVQQSALAIIDFILDKIPGPR